MQRRTIKDTLTLSNSVKIPQLGFGVYQSPKDRCIETCATALENGYRHIDTAQYYGNEDEVGRAVEKSSLNRQDIFITTKVLSAEGSVDKTYQKCLASVKTLDAKSEYVDLFLIHSPDCGFGKRKEMWLALEKLYHEGKAKSIGVSNFGIGQIEELKQFASVWPPHVCQIELHPWLQQKEIVAYCEKNKIVVEAYCPLVRNLKAEDATLVQIAKKHDVSPSQTLLRYSLQKNWVPLPKSDNPERIKSNRDIYGFDLDEDDMRALDGLDRGSAGAIVQAVNNS